MTRRGFKITSILIATFLAIAACGDDSGTPTVVDGASGSVAVSGSSTVEPISARVAQAFATDNPGLAISVQGPGTGDGFQLFCSGQIDISDASRPIKEAEAAACAAAGIEWIELTVAIDGLSVITSVNNDLIDCLSTSDLYALLGDESIGFDSWSDANALAAEVGAPHAPYPDVRLKVTGPGEESGTFDSFVEFVIHGVAGGENYKDTRGVSLVRPDYTASAQDNVIIEGITGSDYSLGWVGYAFYEENRDRVKAIDVAVGGGPCVAPTDSAIADGSYPFARPLYIYVSANAASEKPEVAAFVDYYLSDEGLAAVTDAGYVRLASYDAVRQAWVDRAVGSR